MTDAAPSAMRSHMSMCLPTTST